MVSYSFLHSHIFCNEFFMEAIQIGTLFKAVCSMGTFVTFSVTKMCYHLAVFAVRISRIIRVMFYRLNCSCSIISREDSGLP